MSSRTAMIQWYAERVGKVSYASDPMERFGPDAYDSASALLASLVAGKFLSDGCIHGDMSFILHLEGVLLHPINSSQVQAGDVFIADLSFFGHQRPTTYCGVFQDKIEVYVCSPEAQGIDQIARCELPRLRTRYYRLSEPVNNFWLSPDFKVKRQAFQQ